MKPTPSADPLAPQPAAAAAKPQQTTAQPKENCGAADLRLHSAMLALSAGVLLLSCVLRIRDQREVILPVVQRALPEICTFKRLAGLDCPGCGLTRSFISLGGGDLASAVRYNPAGVLLFIVVALQVPYRALQIGRIRRGRAEIDPGPWAGWLIMALAILLILQWCLRTVVAVLF